MSEESQEHYALELDRARKAFKAAKILYQEKLYEDSVSRSYYAVMHAARAALSTISVFPNSHPAVRRLFGLHLVKRGMFGKEYSVILTAEQEDREMGDYGIGYAIPQDRAQARLEEAEKFIAGVEAFVKEGDGHNSYKAE